MLTRSMIGQEETYIPSFDPFASSQYESVAPTSAPATFSWGSIWQPVKEVLTTGAQIFGQVYPAIKGTPYPSPYPMTTGPVYKPGAVAINPQTGQPYQPVQAGMPTWLLPVVAGVGGFMLINMMGKRR